MHIAADDALQDRHHDGANQLGDLHPGAYSDYTGYATANIPDVIRDPDRWQPLNEDRNGAPSTQVFYMPHWGRVKPFGFKSVLVVRPQASPKTLRTDPAGYILQAKDLVELTNNLTRAAEGDCRVLGCFTRTGHELHPMESIRTICLATRSRSTRRQCESCFSPSIMPCSTRALSHGIKAGYVRNIERDPHVRLKLREGLRYRWHEGTAHLLLDDDPREHQRWLATQLPSSAGNARAVRLFGTQLLSIRIDLGD